MQVAHEAIGKQKTDTAWESIFDSGSITTNRMPEMVKQSWERSRQRGLSASDSLILNEITLAHQRFVEERSRQLICAAIPEMTTLSNALAKTNWMLACIDFEGTVIKSMGNPGQEFEELKLVLSTGVKLGESTVGTTGPGCALIEKRPVIVRGNEHFLQEAKNFLCVSVPIFDPRGNLTGVLDASCNYRTEAAPIIEPLIIAGRAVENRMVYELANATFIRFHHRSDMVGTPLEGILAFSTDGCLLGVNQTARHILSLDRAPDSPIAFDSLFDTSYHHAIDQLRKSQLRPVSLDSSNGMRFQARIGHATDLVPNTLRTARITPSNQPKKEIRNLLQASSSAPDIVTLDAAVYGILEKAHRAFARDIPILINGETGTGKEVVARLLHSNGPRSKGPFVAINCSSIPASLIESELFGYVEGAFTGGRRGGGIGKLEQANGGTLFLDEIGDMPMELQVSLLRVLQERSFTRLGSTSLINIETSVICATHRDLTKLLQSNSFREDLYYRINGLRVALPALRERTDVEILIRHFLRQATAERETLIFSERAMLALLRYNWPGNIRQLNHVIHLAAVLAEDDGTIDLPHLPQEIVEPCGSWGSDFPPKVGNSPRQSPASLEQIECDAIRAAILANNGNISATARSLRISRQTLYKKLKQFRLADLAAGTE